MEDRYLFRGKDVNDGEWIYGSLIEKVSQYSAKDKAKIRLMCIAETGKDDDGYVNHYNEVQINPDTIGQCTGLKDKNKKLFFDGDKCLSGDECESDILYIVRWNKTYCYFYFEIVDRESGEHIDAQPFSDWTAIDHFEIIGNIHDNPELLKTA